MKSKHILFGGLFIGLVAGSQAAAALPVGNPYLGTITNPYLETITNRNLFQLKSPMPVVAVDPTPRRPLREIKLSGMTGIYDQKLAILRVPRNARPPEPPEVSVILGEGAPAEEGVRVLEINLPAGTVRIMNGDTEQLLDISKSTLK